MNRAVSSDVLPQRPHAASSRSDCEGNRRAPGRAETPHEVGQSTSTFLRPVAVIGPSVVAFVVLLLTTYSALLYVGYDFGPILFFLRAELAGESTARCVDLPPEIWKRIPACL